MRLVECVPNISEGRRPEVWEAAAKAAASVPGVTVLNVDPGAETNRTVITFVGEPEAVLEGAFRLIGKAAELIDMSTHKGAHARIGATDVVPFVPVAGVTMDDCAELARRLGARVGAELAMPVYLYEFAASAPYRRNLADIRAGEYEGLQEKLKDPHWQPDFGPAVFNPRTGATVIGARKFLIAYNINLNTADKRLATRVALDVREKGRMRRDVHGQPVLDEHGQPVWDPGILRSVKAVGWYIPEFGCAQISMNLTDMDVTPLHVAFDTCDERASERGLRVTGSELVGLVPKQALLAAGSHYLQRMGRSTGIPEEAILQVAVRTLGLGEVKPFDLADRVIDYRLAPPAPLVGMTLRAFADELSSDSPAPGGGSVSAVAGALGAALAAMVANLSHPKKGFEALQPRLEEIAVRGQAIKARLLAAVDDDTRAFDDLLAAMRLPKGTPEEQAARTAAIALATVSAIEVPLSVLEACPEIIELCREVARIGLQASKSDAGTGAQVARAAAAGAYQNVCINLPGLTDKARGANLLARADTAWQHAQDQHRLAEAEILGALRTAAQ
ncbi:MAG TPA: glutamate formimidoyltransferase [Thermoanaerobaculaceae bacterium]|nr:glutamate formimidoyltransferase [Thermoanaerobaculaceae bacterium]HPS78440.1 glutamate formimidoyltransferase [Thermoanaerobaculaceae bacterium]